MKKEIKKAVVTWIVATMLCSSLCGCSNSESGSASNQADSEYITITKDVCNMVGDTPQDMVDFLTELAPDMAEDISADDEADGVRVYLSGDALQQWEQILKDKIGEVDSSAGLSVNDDFTELDFCYDLNWLSTFYINNSAAAVKEAAMYPMVYCAMYQELHGIREWTFEEVLTNSKTNKIVTTSTFEWGEENASGELSPTDEQWAASFMLTSEESETLMNGASEDVTFLMLSLKFLDAEEIIAIERDVIGTNYSYMFSDENGDVWIGLNEAQKGENITACEDYISQLADQFQSEGTDYKIEINEDYTDISFYFNASLDEQSQVNYVAYTETACQMIGMLSEQENAITLHILNSATGETVADGDSESGIEWSMN